MSIKQNGGVFGRNPTFNNVDIDGQINGTTIPSNAVLARTDQAQTFIGDNVFPETSFTGHVKVSAGKGLAYSGNTATYMSPEDNIQGARIAAGGSFILSVDGGTEAIHVNGTNKNVTISNGNLVIGTSGNGIDFSATAGTGTSELFDDYEEGTWTPALLFGGASTGITYSHQTGIYTKIGNIVNFSLRIRISSAGSATGSATISGLPFAPTSPNGYTNRGYLAETNGVTAVMPNGVIIDLQQVITLYDGNGNARAALDNGDFTTNSYLTIVGAYQA